MADPGMYRSGDRVVIIDPTGRHRDLIACPDCDGVILLGPSRQVPRRPALCDTCGGWGAVQPVPALTS